MSDPSRLREDMLVRLDALRSRLDTLATTFVDPALREQCTVALTDLQLMGSLVHGVRADGSVRALTRMVDVRAKQVEHLEQVLAERGPEAKAFC